MVIKSMKNKTQKFLPLSHSLVLILKEYLKFRGGEPDDYLFCTQYGKQMSISGIQSAIQNYNKKRRRKKDLYALVSQ